MVTYTTKKKVINKKARGALKMSHILRTGFPRMLFVVTQAFVCLMKAGRCHEPRKSLFTMDHVWFDCAGLAMRKKKRKRKPAYILSST